jgi:uncharacterized cupredoxin-like copper-binding protein
VTARDPAQIPVEEIDGQFNLVMVDVPVERSQVDACRFDSTPPGVCPSWRPAAAGETTALVTQRVFTNPAILRHGLGANEFLTITARSLEVSAGSTVRFNLASLSDESHTLDLGGLTAIDPSGGSVTSVRLGPGETSWLLVENLPAGALELGCAEHDHRGLGRVALLVSES